MASAEAKFEVAARAAADIMERPPGKVERQATAPCAVMMEANSLMDITAKPPQARRSVSMRDVPTAAKSVAKAVSAGQAAGSAGDLACVRAERELVTKALKECTWEGLKLVSSLSSLSAMSGYSKDSSLHRAAWDGDFLLVRTLLNLGGDPKLPDQDGNTPIHYAAWNGKVEAVMFLSEHGGDVNARNKRGETPLMHAVRSKHTNTFEALLALGARVNGTDTSGWTPLHHGVMTHNVEMIKFLVANGANLTAVDKAGRKPRDLVFASNHILPCEEIRRRRLVDELFNEFHLPQ